MTVPAPTRVRLYPPGGHQLTLNLVQAGQEAAVVLGARASAGVFLVKSDFEQWRDAAWAAFRTLCQNDVSCTGATGRHVHAAAGAVHELGAPPLPSGASTSLGGTASGATLIKWATNTGGRSGKGRTFLPGLPLNAISTGGRAYSPAHSTAVSTAISAYLGHAAFQGAMKPAVLSFTKGAAYDITGGALAPIIGLQRRRMR